VTIFVSIIRILCDALTILILIRVVVSWYALRPTNALVRILRWLTEPILAPLRRIIPRVGRFDFTPLVAIILIQSIYYLAYYLLP